MRNLKIVCFKKGVRKIKFLIILWIWLITGCSLPVNRTVEQDKAWYADRDPNTNEPKTTVQMFFTVYYAEKGDKMLHHFQGKIDIGSGNGGIISQLKMQNEMKLTDESWISYQQGKGNARKR